MQIKEHYLLSKKKSEDRQEAEEKLNKAITRWYDKVFHAIINSLDEENNNLQFLFQIENIIKQYTDEYNEILSENIHDFYIQISETSDAQIKNEVATKNLDTVIILSTKDEHQSKLDQWLQDHSSINNLKEQIEKKLRFNSNIQSTLDRYLPNFLHLDLEPTQFTIEELLQFQVDQAVIEYMSNNIFKATENTMQRVTQKIYDIIKDSYAQQGHGIDQVTRDIQSKFTELKTFEAERIARTETLKAQSHATYQRLLNNPDVHYMQWISTADRRTRRSHRKLDGQITYADATGIFSNGLRFPGDINGPIEEWINCRCDPVAFLAEPGYVPPAGALNWYEHEMILDKTIAVPEVEVELSEYLASWW